jgi:hypothetical protein
MHNRLSTIKVTKRTEVLDLLRELNTATHRQFEENLVRRRRCFEPSGISEARFFFRPDGTLVLEDPEPEPAPSWRAARAGVVILFVLVAAVCGVLLG